MDNGAGVYLKNLNEIMINNNPLSRTFIDFNKEELDADIQHGINIARHIDEQQNSESVNSQLHTQITTIIEKLQDQITQIENTKHLQVALIEEINKMYNCCCKECMKFTSELFMQIITFYSQHNHLNKEQINTNEINKYLSEMEKTPENFNKNIFNNLCHKKTNVDEQLFKLNEQKNSLLEFDRVVLSACSSSVIDINTLTKDYNNNDEHIKVPDLTQEEKQIIHNKTRLI